MLKLSRSKILYFFILFLGLGISSPSLAQTKQVEKQEKKQKKHKKTQEELEKEAIKRHKKIQTKAVQKRMKRSLREAERRKKGKNPIPWYSRIFPKKRKKRRYKGEK